MKSVTQSSNYYRPTAVLVLLAAALPSVAALKVGSFESDAGNGSWSFWTEPERGTKRALLVLVGLLRNVDANWEKLLQSFIKPNEAQGYSFDVMLHTSLTVRCSEKDLNLNRLGCEKQSLVSTGTAAEKLASLHALFRPYNVTLVNADDPCTTDATEAWSYNPQLEWMKAASCGTMHFTSRSVQSLDRRKGGLGYHRVIILRTDNALERTNASDGEVLLDAACDRHPGVNIIGNRNILVRGAFHKADYDHGALLCSGAHAHVFREALGQMGIPCSEARCPGGKPPPHPADFTWGSHYWSCLEPMCGMAAVLHRAGLRFGHTDDYVVAA